MPVEFDINTWAAHYKICPPLMTEQPHPRTMQLSALVKNDLTQAINDWRDIDLAMLNTLPQYSADIACLKTAAKLSRRIILIGCGSSGRLAFWCQHHIDDSRIHSILAGGTGALIRSQEGMEDSNHAGKQDLAALLPNNDDIVIGLTASGRTPYVLGALEHAKQCGAQAWLIANNPVKLIKPRIAMPDLLDNIRVLALNVGPMALTGSTRLQATTAMQIALLQVLTDFDLAAFHNYFAALDWQGLANSIPREGELLLSPPVTYTCDDICLQTVLADLTERAPTFGVSPITPSPCHSPWRIAGPNPQQLSALVGFDLPEVDATHAMVIKHIDAMQLFDSITLPKAPLHWQLLALKCLLNCHSTLVMGRLGYFDGNMMTHMAANNAKLIDRAIRYILALHPQCNYRQVALKAVSLLPDISKEQSLIQLLQNFSKNFC